MVSILYGDCGRIVHHCLAIASSRMIASCAGREAGLYWRDGAIVWSSSLSLGFLQPKG
jgi:hypothetical protein